MRPFTYSLAEHFPIGERCFCSVLGQTFPNRCYFFAATSSGTINDTFAPNPPANGTIFDRLDAHDIDWAIYFQDLPSLAIDVPGAFDRYGFRVPLIVVSPWAKPSYVSRVTQDHTSITAFIERKWNLPAMTFRDANAHPMTDYFDFRRPTFQTPPRLAAAPRLGPGLAECLAAGLSPPTSGSGGPS
jgi:phospholipase C